MAPDGTRPARFAGHEYPQILPEPDDIQAGALAPWSTLPLSEQFAVPGVTVKLMAPVPDPPAVVSVNLEYFVPSRLVK